MASAIEGKYLIYAEDDLDDRQLLIELMNKVSPEISVVSVDNGSEVISYLQNLEPDQLMPCFILLDINMPVMNGYETLSLLKAHSQFKDITVIVYSTSSDIRDREKSLAMGAKRFIVKPFSLQQIEALSKAFVNYCEEIPQQRR